MKNESFLKIAEIKDKIGFLVEQIRYLEGLDEEDNKEKLENLKLMLRINTQLCSGEIKLFVEEIDFISDELLRTILCLKYINGLNWKQISFSIGEISPYEVKKIHDEFMQKNIGGN